MSKEGYLIYHEKARQYQIVFCVLEGGKLQLFTSRQNPTIIKEVNLSCTSVSTLSNPELDENLWPHSFKLRIQRSKVCAGQVVGLSSTITMVFGASSAEEKEAWKSSIAAWRRKYWGHAKSKEEIANKADDFFESQYQTLKWTMQVAIAVRKESLFFQLFQGGLSLQNKDNNNNNKVGQWTRQSIKPPAILPQSRISIYSNPWWNSMKNVLHWCRHICKSEAGFKESLQS